MNSIFGQSILITVMGMGVTFAALGLVMASMFILTRLAKDREESTAESTEPEQTTGEVGMTQEPIDIELEAGASMAEVAAAAVAVATARELARRRHSAQVWLSPQPRTLISPWQMVARDKQLARIKQQ